VDLHRWVEELRRRRVFRALVGYGIAALIVLRASDSLLQAARLPEWILSVEVVVLGLGFPVAVALAWVFDLSSRGVERTPAEVGAGGLALPHGARLAGALIGLGLLAAAPGLVYYFALRGGRPAEKDTKVPSIAVLPFADMSPQKDQEYFSDGIAEEILNALAHVEGLHVAGRTSSFSFKGKSDDVASIAQKLHVGAVLEGSVRKEGSRLRITAQLVNASDGYHLWSETYDRELTGIFAVQGEISRAVVEALKVKLLPGRGPRVQQATASTEAHDLYLQGRFFWNQRTKEGLAKATALLEQAIELDPGYALAHSGLADCYSLSVEYGGAPAAQAYPKAMEHALKAVELDDGLAEAHASLGQIKQDEYDWSAAEREYERAIELRPGYPTAHHWYAINLLSRGRIPEARAEAERARQLDPTSFIVSSLIAFVFFDSRMYDRAIEQSRKALELNSSFEHTRVVLVKSYRQTGRFAEALAALDEAATGSSQLSGLRAEVLAASGKSAEAQRILADLERRFSAEPLPRGTLAAAHLALGDKDATFVWLARGVDERDPSLFDLKANPQWDPIRPDRRFRELLQRMNLE
jgi:TolB-like protein/tetratricopeptide (TPR) repeat protein